MLLQYKITLSFILLMTTFIVYYSLGQTNSATQVAANPSSKYLYPDTEKKSSSLQIENNKDAVFLSALQKVNNKLSELSTTIAGVKNDIDLLNAQKSEGRFEDNNETIALNEANKVESSDDQIKIQEQSYEERFLAEQDDPEWSAEIEKITLDSFAQVSDVLTGVELNCRSSLCKLNMSRSNDMIESDEVFEAFEASVNWEGEMYVNYDPETGEGTAYLAKPGSTLNIDNMENEG
ncbi:MAG: hypothetical protein ACKE51_07300 [Methylococcaceae bacterium]